MLNTSFTTISDDIISSNIISLTVGYIQLPTHDRDLRDQFFSFETQTETE